MIRVGPRPTARTIWIGHSVVNRCIGMRVVQRSRCAEADAASPPGFQGTPLDVGLKLRHQAFRADGYSFFDSK
jgi:hypothetical protein